MSLYPATEIRISLDIKLPEPREKAYCEALAIAIGDLVANVSKADVEAAPEPVEVLA